MRALIIVLLPFLALFLQTTFFRSFSIQGAVPDLLLILVIFYSVFNGSTKGAVYGVACGIWEDLYQGRIIGVNAICKGITAFILGRMQGEVFQENILVGVIGVLGGTIINVALLFMISFLAIPGFSLNRAILADVVYHGVYNVIISAPIYIWYLRSSRGGVLREGQSI
ncbi:MAG: rod shape-determining protein MreD [Syntrophomonadaceae bacterium]|nr:rod shape-determining protein MreD [Syntrophomonadaceae bacterium]